MEPGVLYDGLIFMKGEINVQESAIDIEFNVCSTDNPILFRKVETYCYKQETNKRIEKKGDMQRTVTDYKYTSVWLSENEFIDSSNFKD